jgi:hypothetical protein
MAITMGICMTNYPTKPGYYYRNGKWHPSKKTKKKRAEDRLVREISEQLRLFPEKYPYGSFALSQASAKHNGLEVWWQKCKKGHLTERKVTESGCPVCTRITRDLRDKRIKEGRVELSKHEEMRLHEIYKNARRKTKETGIAHHVDHIRPLAAGGVHHPDNLQIITAEENLLKSSFYNGKKSKYSRAEKKVAHAEFFREKQENEERARAQQRAQRNRAEQQNFLRISGFVFAAIIIFLVLKN